MEPLEKAKHFKGPEDSVVLAILDCVGYGVCKEGDFVKKSEYTHTGLAGETWHGDKAQRPWHSRGYAIGQLYGQQRDRSQCHRVWSRICAGRQTVQ